MASGIHRRAGVRLWPVSAVHELPKSRLENQTMPIAICAAAATTTAR